MQPAHKTPFFEKLEDRQLLSSGASTGLSKYLLVSANTAPAIEATPQLKAAKKTVKKAVSPAKNLLFFGNSFTLYNNVPEAVAQIAEAAGDRKSVV